ncbi:MAG: glycosyltransferase [Prevotellaceae bacterium]|jgi:glycosyltransferase involved in cell wall biosynthesis|nr:glycosyltransferase [Prevotellaceae bacterium]
MEKQMNINKYPLVTVIATSYNQEKFLVESLNSIISQTYSNIQLIICDDCSQDNSVTIIDEWIQHNKINCIFLKHTINQGLFCSLNETLTYAKGKYLQFIALDDVLFPNKIENQVALLEQIDDSYAMVYGDMMLINENGDVLYNSLFSHSFGDSFSPLSGDLFIRIVKDFFYYNQASLIKLEAIKNIQFKFDSKFISEDWHLQLHLAQQYKIKGTSDIVVKYRFLENSLTRCNWIEEKMHLVIESHFKMIYALFDSEKKNKKRRNVIRDKLHSLLFALNSCKNISRKKLFHLALLVFIKSRHWSDIKVFIRLLQLYLKNIIVSKHYNSNNKEVKRI